MSENTERFSELAHFYPWQIRATEARRTHQYTLTGGARGPGKSHWLRWDGLLQLLEYAQQGIRGVTWTLFCEDYPVLRDRQITKIATEFPRWLGELKESKQSGLGFHLKPEYGGGFLALRNLEDPTKYQSFETGGLGIDELTKNELSTFDILRGSLRWPGIPRPRFTAGTNPGGIGHAWVKGFWLDGVFPQEMADQAGEFAFIRALPTDNPALTQEYWDMLNSIQDENLRRAWRWGDWDVFAGLFFSQWRSVPTGDQLAHVIPTHDVPRDWTLYGSVDYGFNAGKQGEMPFSYGLYGHHPNGHSYLVDELAAAEWGVSKQIEAIKELEGRYEQAVISRQGCPFMFTEQRKGAPTIAEDYAKAGVPVQPSNTDHVNGWARCREWLNVAPDGRPWFMVFDRCKQFIKIITSVVFDERHPEDVDPKCEDHALEQWRHHAMSRPRPPVVPYAPVDPWSAQAIDERIAGTARKQRYR